MTDDLYALEEQMVSLRRDVQTLKRELDRQHREMLALRDDLDFLVSHAP